MRGYFKLLNSLTFSVRKSPSPTICDCPPFAQLGEGFQCIDFIYKFDLFVEKQPVDSLTSPSWARVFRTLCRLNDLSLGESFFKAELI